MRFVICITLFYAYSYCSITNAVKHTKAKSHVKIRGLNLNLKNPKTEKCSELNCPLDRGTCIDEFTCKCNDPQSTTSLSHCSYSRKYRHIAILLESILPLGIGHLYLRQIIIACFKFLLFLAFIILGSKLYILLTESKEKTSRTKWLVLCILSTYCLIFFLLHLLDIYSLIWLIHKDGFGVDLI